MAMDITLDSTYHNNNNNNDNNDNNDNNNSVNDDDDNNDDDNNHNNDDKVIETLFGSTFNHENINNIDNISPKSNKQMKAINLSTQFEDQNYNQGTQTIDNTNDNNNDMIISLSVQSVMNDMINKVELVCSFFLKIFF